MNDAVITKARAMYGKRLSLSDYQALVSFSGVSEAAAFLKRHPGYNKVLGSINEELIHRGHLEALIRREYYDEYARLCSNLFGGDKLFSDVYILSYEMELLLMAIRASDKRQGTEFADFKSEFIGRHSGLDFVKLMSAADHRALISELNGTIYYDILAPTLDLKEGHIDYILAERRLSSNYYKRLYLLMKKHLSPYSRSQVQKLFGTETDLNNLISMYRLRKYFGADTAEVGLNLIKPFYRLSDQVVLELMSVKTRDEVRAVLSKTAYKNLIPIGDTRYIEELCDRWLMSIARRTLHFSRSAPAVVFGYLLFKRIEIRNIKIVIESLRYGIDKDMVLPRLITEKG